MSIWTKTMPARTASRGTIPVLRSARSTSSNQ
jgi:hypothetical protein